MDVRVLQKGMGAADLDREFSGLSKDITDLAKRVVSATDQCYLARCDYKEAIWRDCQFSDTKLIPPLENPVGLVLRGILEVTEEFRIKKKPTDDGIPRRRATALIRPGQFFGLFEAFAGLFGHWRITSGVTRILITNRLAHNKLLKKLKLTGGHSDMEPTLRFSPTAKFDYDELLDRAKTKAPNWHSSILLFDSNVVSDPSLTMLLQSQAIAQLSSLVRQNPTDSFVAHNVGGYHLDHSNPDTNKVLATLDAILRGLIPVFRLADSNDEALLPYSALLEVLGFHDDTLHHHGPHVFIPDSASLNSIRVYAHALSHKIGDLSKLDTTIAELSRNKIDLLAGIKVSKLCQQEGSEQLGKAAFCAAIELSTGEQFTLHKTSRSGTKNADAAIDDATQTSKGGINLPCSFTELLFEGKRPYGWPTHLSDMIVIIPNIQCTNCSMTVGAG